METRKETINGERRICMQIRSVSDQREKPRNRKKEKMDDEIHQKLCPWIVLANSLGFLEPVSAPRALFFTLHNIQK